jgi:FHS family L-fucose permease-like MFS transporter
MLWGFITVMNGSLSEKIKNALNLTSSQEDLLSFVFFGGYFIVGLIMFLLCRYVFDPFIRFGYKRMLIFGLIITAIACFMFYPAAIVAGIPDLLQSQKFNFFLASMILLSSGFTILQITANSYVISLGNIDTASARINLSQGFNSLGTYLAPLIFTLLFLDGDTSNQAADIKLPYLTIGFAVVFLALLFSISTLPDIKFPTVQGASKSLKNEKQLLLGALAIFLYVGGEVAIGSHLEDYLQLEYIANFDKITAQRYTALYWGGAMVGRFTGVAFLSRIEKSTRRSILLLLTVLCYLLGLSISNDHFTAFIYTFLFLFNVLGYQLGAGRSAKTLGVFGAIVIVCIFMSVFNTGHVSMWAMIIIGMFNSIMFPVIFRLGIDDLQSKTSMGSSLLVLAIVGGALIPSLQTLLITKLNYSFQSSFIVPALCYAFISYYGFSIFRKNG